MVGHVTLQLPQQVSLQSFLTSKASYVTVVKVSLLFACSALKNILHVQSLCACCSPLWLRTSHAPPVLLPERVALLLLLALMAAHVTLLQAHLVR